MVVVLLMLLVMLPGGAHAQQTRAEATSFLETTSSADVWAFLEEAGYRPDTLAVTVEGRPIAVAQWVGRSAHVRVLVVANIHAGEVEGKEAVLAVLRDWMHNAPDWAQALHLAVVPNLNADGNDRIAVDHRPYQLGPEGGMGTRANAQGLDLNRDFVKLDAPEARGLVAFVRGFDPHLIIDLHATNGSFHGYHLTYAPGLHPATPEPVTRLVRDHILPSVTQRMRSLGWETEHYGNFRGYQRRPVERPGEIVWSTFDYRPRFLTNYFALAGYPTILSEAYAYLSFEDRIAVSRDFVLIILQDVSEGRDEGTGLPLAAPIPPDSVFLAASLGPAEPFTLLLAEVDEVPHPVTGAIQYRQRPERTPVEALRRTAFVGQRAVSRPDAYLLSMSDSARIAMLLLHGIGMEALSEGSYPVERFAVEERVVAERPFQGIHEVREAGRYLAETLHAEEGAWIRVPTSGRDAALVVFLLEPESTDGLVTWQRASTLEHPLLRLPHGN